MVSNEVHFNTLRTNVKNEKILLGNIVKYSHGWLG